jgi:hypothetical protein
LRFADRSDEPNGSEDNSTAARRSTGDAVSGGRARHQVIQISNSLEAVHTTKTLLRDAKMQKNNMVNGAAAPL